MSTRPVRRNTRERILEAALGMFNRFGEPNVSINSVANDLGISPGNLYYHFPSKDSVTEALVQRHCAELKPLLNSAHQAEDVETAWFFVHSLFEHVWQARFIYRDQNNLLIKTRLLEDLLHDTLEDKIRAFESLLASLESHGWARFEARNIKQVAHTMAVVINYWMSFAYVRQPRQALEPDSQQAAVLEGVQNALGVLLPYLQPTAQSHLTAIMAPYQVTGAE